MDSLHQPVLQACPGCDAMIDVSDQEPFEQVPCPVCQTTIRARTQFNNFTLIDVLGSGGMGAVYRALDQNLQRYVALKVVRREHTTKPAHLESFEREARITAAVNHPNVVKVFSFGQDHGSFYIAMELVNKGSLDELIQMHKRVPEGKALQIGLQIARGLRAANQLGLIHRDIKPGNILFADDHTAKIVDFGLATVLGRGTEGKGEVWGTPFYVSPERLKDQTEDFRSDIYSLGATLFHAIAGKPPYESSTLSVSALRQLRSRPVNLLAVAPDVSSPTAAVIDRMLKEKPEDRFQSYDELIDLLSYAIGRVVAEPLGSAHGSAPAKRGNQSRWLTYVAILAALSGAGFWGARHYRVFEMKGERPPVEVRPRGETLLEGQYSEALAKLRSGDYPAAISLFSQIQDSPSIKPLLLRWVLFQSGVAHLFAGHPREAEATFAQLAEKGPYSDAPADRPLASFFVEIGKAGAAGGSSSAIKPAPSPSETQALSWLVLGLSHYQTGDSEQAERLLTAFLHASPEESFRPYAKHSDYKAGCRAVLSAIQAKKARPVAAEAQPVATPVATEQTASPTPSEQADSPTPTPEDPLAKAELEKVLHLREKFAASVASYRFTDAQLEVGALDLKTEAAQKKKTVILKVSDWLLDFKKRLVADLDREGFPYAIKGTNGSTLEGGIGGATEKEVKLKTPYGVIPIEWGKVSPDSVSSMAVYFLKKEKDPAVFAEKKWELGIYLCQFGRGKVGRPILAELAPTKPEYADALEEVLELSQ